MKVISKNISDTKVELLISLDAEEMAIAEQVAAKKLAETVKVPGFRKGRTPIAVALKSIDPSVLQEEAVNNAISKSVAEAFLETKLQVLNRPEVEVKKFVPGESIEFTAQAEILPKVKLGDYKKLKVKVDKQEVLQTEIDEVVDRIRKGLAQKTSVERPIVDGDEATIDFEGKKDGIAFDGGKGSSYPLLIGSKQFIPGFEEGLVGHKKGDKLDLPLAFPDNYGVEGLSGQKVVFSIEIKEVKEIILPEKNDEFAKKAGPFTTFLDLEADIKRELLAQKTRESDEKLKEDLISQLVEKSHVPVPEVLVQDQMQSIERDFNQNLMYQGLTLEQYLKSRNYDSKEKWLEDEVKNVAIKRVKSGLVLAELSKQEKIEATNLELDEKINQYKQQYAKNAEALSQFEQPEVRRDIANRLLTEKTVDMLVSYNKK